MFITGILCILLFITFEKCIIELDKGQKKATKMIKWLKLSPLNKGYNIWDYLPWKKVMEGLLDHGV